MARHNELGIEGEEIACHYLEEKGYVILERNWRSGKHEIDIVVSKDKELVFVEVKTRSEAYTKEAIEAAYSRKINFLAAAANHYLQGHDTGNMQPRFDHHNRLLKWTFQPGTHGRRLLPSASWLPINIDVAT